MTLPNDLKQLVDEALEAVHNHPQHELIRANRKKFFKLFRISYIKTGKWLAILTARKVHHIFEEKWDALLDPDSEFRQEMNRSPVDIRTQIQYIVKGHLSQLEDLYYRLQLNAGKDIAKRMVDIAEDVVCDFLDQKYASYNANTFYFDILSYAILKEPKDAYYAFWAAYQTLLASYQDEPFDYATIYIPVDNPQLRVIGNPKNLENEKYTKSTVLSDELLVEEGFSSDFAIYAAFSYAYETDIKSCNPSKFQEFWEWWLKEAIPQAWEKAIASDKPE